MRRRGDRRGGLSKYIQAEFRIERPQIVHKQMTRSGKWPVLVAWRRIRPIDQFTGKTVSGCRSRGG
jgi:hypothetical protein